MVDVSGNPARSAISSNPPPAAPNRTNGWLAADHSPSLKVMLRIATMCLGLYWAAIFIATHLPKSSLPKLEWSDKLYHFVAYAGLSFLLAWAIPSRSRTKQILLTAVIGVAYACVDELTQHLVPGRYCDVGDMLADAFGVGIGILAYLICRRALSSWPWGQKLIQFASR